MASRILLFSVSCIVLFSGCLARQQQAFPQFNECQLNNLDALQPDNRIESEAGVTEVWNHNHPQFRCAGVAVVKRTIECNGLHLPSYTNTHQIDYVVRGSGLIGLSFPGCAETFEGSQQREAGRQIRGDRHQKIREFRQGDIIAIPAGVAYWAHNNGDSPVVVVSLLDVGNNNANQLDQNPRRFYLAGNPEEEHQQQGRSQGQKQGDTSNVFSGFDREFLAQVFDNIDIETIRNLQGERDNRRNIVRVQGRLQYLSPIREEGRQEYERDSNGLEETICSLKVTQNIDNPRSADIFNPQAGRITTVNGFDLPILNMLRLSAQRVKLYRNGIFVPHWSNAHSIMYITRGSGRVQVVDDQGNSVFNREVREGEILTVPQNFAMAKQAGDEGFDFVVFKTSSNAKNYPLIGRTSVLRAMPEDVLANAFQVQGNEARNIKFNVEETFLVSGERSQRQRMSEGYIKL